MIEPEVAKVIDELETFQKTVDNAWNVPREEGLLLHNIILAGGCKRLVEVGTSYGFSGLFLASAARSNGGVLETFEVDPAKQKSAGETFASAGLGDVINLHAGDAAANLAGLTGEVDFAFIDAAKDQTMDYWRAVEPRLTPRCIVTVDNIDSKADQMVELLALLQDSPDFTYCQVQVGNGFAMAVRVA